MRTRLEIPRTAFPLVWPPGVARCKYRENARFHGTTTKSRQYQDAATGHIKTNTWKVYTDLSVAESRDDVLEQLRLLGANNPVVLSSNLATRLDGLPRAGQVNPADPGVAVYFMLDKHETCIAIDRFFRVADNLRAVAKTIEAMRGVERWGGASLVAAAFTGFQALPAPGAIVPPRPWHEVIGMPPLSSTDDVEARGRKLSAELHPDKRPGDVAAEAKFVEIREAIETFRRERGIGA